MRLAPGALFARPQLTVSTTPINATASPPVVNKTFETAWAPLGCGNIAVPAWQDKCLTDGAGQPLNTTVVNVFLPLGELNGTFLRAHARVWDAWAGEFGAELAAATGIPRAQLKVTWAGRCPPAPWWLGAGAGGGANVDCVTVEFTEEPGAAFALGLIARAAVYRLAAAVGATAPAAYFGAFIPPTLASAGVTPGNALLQPLWTGAGGAPPRAGRGGAPLDVLATASFAVVYAPARRADRFIIGTGPGPLGRNEGRLIDLPGLRASSGLALPAPPFNAGPLTAAAASLGALAGVAALAAAGLWRALRATGAAPRPPARRVSVSRAGSASAALGDPDVIAKSAAAAAARGGLFGSAAGALRAAGGSARAALGAAAARAAPARRLSARQQAPRAQPGEDGDDGAPAAFAIELPERTNVVRNPLSALGGFGSAASKLWGGGSGRGAAAAAADPAATRVHVADETREGSLEPSQEPSPAGGDSAAPGGDDYDAHDGGEGDDEELIGAVQKVHD
jgi:hypothetical protein